MAAGREAWVDHAPDSAVGELRRLLTARVGAGAGQVLARTRATIVLDAAAAGCWTVGVSDGRVSVRDGRVRHADTCISAALPVLIDVVGGRRAGVEAFLAGELTIRGNMSLALALDGVFHDQSLPARHPRSRMVLANGIRTSFLEAGPADAPPIVLVHGLGATNGSMLTLLWELADDFRVIAPDLPGHGATEAVADDYDADFLGRWLLALLDVAGVDDSVCIIGNSLGGRTALEAAFIAPERVRGLILLAPAVAFRRLRQFIPVVNVLRPELARLTLRFSRAMTLAGLRAMFAVASRVPQPWFLAAADEFVRVMRVPAYRIAFFSALRNVYLDEAFGDRGFWDRLPSLVPPAFFIWGDRDRLVPSGFARHVQEAVPRARSVVLRSCGHVPQFEHPELTVRLIREFMSGLPRAGRAARPRSKRSVA